MESIKASSAPITPSELLRQTQLLLDVFSAFEPETLGKSHTEDGRFNERLACAEQLQTLRTGGRLGGPRTMLSFSDAMTFVYHGKNFKPLQSLLRVLLSSFNLSLHLNP